MKEAVLALSAVLALGAQVPGRITLESLYHPTERMSYIEPVATRPLYRPDGALLEEVTRDGAFFALQALEGVPPAPRTLLDRDRLAAALTAAGADAGLLSKGIAGGLVWNHARTAFILRNHADLVLVELSPLKARRIGAGEAPSFSPDGAWVAYLDGPDLKAVELATGKDVQLTQGGDERHFNGRLDWVYQEEVFNQRGDVRGYWWSPDSRRIAFLSLDETQVPAHVMVDDRAEQKVRSTPYPKAGDPNPLPRLGIASLDGNVAWMEDPYPGQDVLVTRVGWTPAGRLVAHYADRVQSWLDCRIFEGAASRVLVQERGRAWVDPLPLPRFLKDGRFLWLSARSGFTHMYVGDASGQRLAQVTTGAWNVRRILGVDEKANRAYFEADLRGPTGMDACRCDLDGLNSRLRRLTEAPGTHSVTFNATFTAAVDRWSDVDTPAQDLYLDGEGDVLGRGPDRATAAFRALRKGRVVFQQVRTRDGFPMETMLVLPPDFDPSRKYPVFHYVYGGPNAPLVRNAFGRQALWFHFLAQHGIVTWICDNRSASTKGTASAQGVKGNLGALELQDQLDGLEWLRAQGWADMGRIALHGYSYGGFLAGYAMTHSRAWKIGILGGPVTDWRLYDSVYTERYMGLPRENPQGYDAASVLKAAPGLGGKILLIHGGQDGNVHLQNSIQFLDALQKAGKNAPMILMPGSDHSPRAPQDEWAMYQGMWEFLKENL